MGPTRSARPAGPQGSDGYGVRMNADTIRTLASQAYRSMEMGTREDGTQYVRKTEDCPEWVASIIQEAHADFLPDDMRYSIISEAFSWLEDTTTEDPDELEDAHDFADSTTDVYNSQLLAWVGSHGARAGYVDDARDNLGEPRDFYHSLMMGQYTERVEVYAAVFAGLREAAETEAVSS
jgi:hypothetical protein